MRALYDVLTPKGDTLQIRLARKGKVVSALYKDDTQEFRSSTFPRESDAVPPQQDSPVVPAGSKDG